MRPRQLQNEFTPEQLEEFKKEYRTAAQCGFKTFTFQGEEFYTGYALYLLNHIEKVKAARDEKS